jgi:hypothetical protein
MNSSHKSEKGFLVGASVMIVTAISLLSFSTIKLHLSTQRLYVDLQAQEEQFRSFERHRQNLDRAAQLYENGDYDTCIRWWKLFLKRHRFTGRLKLFRLIAMPMYRAFGSRMQIHLPIRGTCSKQFASPVEFKRVKTTARPKAESETGPRQFWQRQREI